MITLLLVESAAAAAVSRWLTLQGPGEDVVIESVLEAVAEGVLGGELLGNITGVGPG